jgi:uncharacterized protein (DUF1919 family)
MTMQAKLFWISKKIKNRLANWVFRQRVKNREFTIVSFDCWGGTIYQELGIPYHTPFVGVGFHPTDYIKLLKNLPEYLKYDLEFIQKASYPEANEVREIHPHRYPLAALGDVEVHFMHYHTEEEARQKWYDRRGRMNYDNLFVEFSDQILGTPEHIREFDRLDFANKVAFTAAPYPDIKSNVWISECTERPENDKFSIRRYLYKRHFDMASWLNGGSGAVTPFYRFINRLFEVRIQDTDEQLFPR